MAQSIQPILTLIHRTCASLQDVLTTHYLQLIDSKGKVGKSQHPLSKIAPSLDRLQLEVRNNKGSLSASAAAMEGLRKLIHLYRETEASLGLKGAPRTPTLVTSGDSLTVKGTLLPAYVAALHTQSILTAAGMATADKRRFKPSPLGKLLIQKEKVLFLAYSDLYSEQHALNQYSVNEVVREALLPLSNSPDTIRFLGADAEARFGGSAVGSSIARLVAIEKAASIGSEAFRSTAIKRGISAAGDAVNSAYAIGSLEPSAIETQLKAQDALISGRTNPWTLARKLISDEYSAAQQISNPELRIAAIDTITSSIIKQRAAISDLPVFSAEFLADIGATASQGGGSPYLQNSLTQIIDSLSIPASGYLEKRTNQFVVQCAGLLSDEIQNASRQSSDIPGAVLDSCDVLERRYADSQTLPRALVSLFTLRREALERLTRSPQELTSSAKAKAASATDELIDSGFNDSAWSEDPAPTFEMPSAIASSDFDFEFEDSPEKLTSGSTSPDTTQVDALLGDIEIESSIPSAEQTICEQSPTDDETHKLREQVRILSEQLNYVRSSIHKSPVEELITALPTRIRELQKMYVNYARLGSSATAGIYREIVTVELDIGKALHLNPNLILHKEVVSALRGAHSARADAISVNSLYPTHNNNYIIQNDFESGLKCCDFDDMAAHGIAPFATFDCQQALANGSDRQMVIVSSITCIEELLPRHGHKIDIASPIVRQSQDVRTSLLRSATDVMVEAVGGIAGSHDQQRSAAAALSRLQRHSDQLSTVRLAGECLADIVDGLIDQVTTGRNNHIANSEANFTK